MAYTPKNAAAMPQVNLFSPGHDKKQSLMQGDGNMDLTHKNQADNPFVDLVRQLFHTCGSNWTVQHTAPVSGYESYTHN